MMLMYLEIDVLLDCVCLCARAFVVVTYCIKIAGLPQLPLLLFSPCFPLLWLHLLHMAAVGERGPPK